jgi:hypothetical protein
LRRREQLGKRGGGGITPELCPFARRGFGWWRGGCEVSPAEQWGSGSPSCAINVVVLRAQQIGFDKMI